MITRQNIKEVINSIHADDVKRLQNTMKEYIVIELHIFNVGSTVTIILTDDYNRYKNVSNYGNCILECNEVIELINN